MASSTGLQMAQIKVLIQVSRATLPSGQVYDHTDIDVVDASGIRSSQVVNGQESPAWTGLFQVAEGQGTVSVTARDTSGNPIGTALSATFNTLAGTFLAPSGILITVL